MPAGLTLTTAGAAEIEAAYRAGNVVTITVVALGDGGGKVPPSTPDEMAAMTTLNGEFGREPFSGVATGEGVISGQIVVDCRTWPGETLREVGLISADGTLLAYGTYPDTFLPAQTDAVVKEVILTLALELTHAESVTLELDPHVMILTQGAGDKRYLQKPVSGETVELVVSYGTVTTVPEGCVQTGLRLDAEGKVTALVYQPVELHGVAEKEN
ncbi:phage tail protein [Salmonella enterica]|nr:phage tail protein [Salmonella enterica]